MLEAFFIIFDQKRIHMNIRLMLLSLSTVPLLLCGMHQELTQVFATPESKMNRLKQLRAQHFDLAYQNDQRLAQKTLERSSKNENTYQGPQIWDVYSSNLYLNENIFAVADQEEFNIDIYNDHSPFNKVASLKSPDMPYGLPGLAQNTNNQLASVAAQSIIVWDMQKYQQLAQLKGHTNLITSIYYDPAHIYQLISSSDDGSIKVWDTRSGTCVQTLQADGRVLSVDVQAGDTGQIASIVSGTNHNLIVWELATSRKLATMSGESTVKYNHDGSSLLTSIAGGALLYDGHSFKLKNALQFPGNWSSAGAQVMAADFTTDGSSVVMSGSDYNIFVCDGLLKNIAVNIDSGMMGVDVHFNASDSQILSSAFGAPYDTGPSVRIWSVEELKKKAAALLASQKGWKCTVQ